MGDALGLVRPGKTVEAFVRRWFKESDPAKGKISRDWYATVLQEVETNDHGTVTKTALITSKILPSEFDLINYLEEQGAVKVLSGSLPVDAYNELHQKYPLPTTGHFAYQNYRNYRDIPHWACSDLTLGIVKVHALSRQIVKN